MIKTKADDIQALMLKATMDVFTSSVLILGDTERELESVRADLIKARQLLRNCVAHMDGAIGRNAGSDTDHLCIDVVNFLGDDNSARPMAE